MLGYDEADIGASPDEWLTRVHPDDAGRVKESLAGASGRRQRRITRASTACCTATARSAGCCAAARRCATPTGRATRLAGSLTDVTDAKVSDALTGLPNRLMFVDLLDRALSRAHRRPGYAFALLVLGLDRFKDVGNSLGPLMADRLLVAVAQRLQSGLRVTDAVKPDDTVCTLARLVGRRVHGAARRHHRRHRRGARRRTAARALEKPFEIDGQQAVHVGHGRHRGQHGEIRPPGRDPARCRDGAPPREGRPDDVVRAVRSGDARPRGRPAAGRDRPAARRSRTAASSSSTSRSWRSQTGRIVAFEALVRWRHPHARDRRAG